MVKLQNTMKTGRNRVKVQSIVEIKNLENGNISQEIDNVSILKASVVLYANINSPCIL